MGNFSLTLESLAVFSQSLLIDKMFNFCSTKKKLQKSINLAPAKNLPDPDLYVVLGHFLNRVISMFKISGLPIRILS